MRMQHNFLHYMRMKMYVWRHSLVSNAITITKKIVASFKLAEVVKTLTLLLLDEEESNNYHKVDIGCALVNKRAEKGSCYTIFQELENARMYQASAGFIQVNISIAVVCF